MKKDKEALIFADLKPLEVARYGMVSHDKTFTVAF